MMSNTIPNSQATPCQRPRLTVHPSAGIDLGTQMEIITKRGAFFSYGDLRLGQGRENAKEYLRQNASLSAEIEAAIRQQAVGGDLPMALAGSGESESFGEE